MKKAYVSKFNASSSGQYKFNNCFETAPSTMRYAEASNLAKNIVNEQYLAFLRGINLFHHTPMHIPVISSVGMYTVGMYDVHNKILFALSNQVSSFSFSFSYTHHQSNVIEAATTPETMRIIVESRITRFRVGGWYRFTRLFAVSNL